MASIDDYLKGFDLGFYPFALNAYKFGNALDQSDDKFNMYCGIFLKLAQETISTMFINKPLRYYCLGDNSPESMQTERYLQQVSDLVTRTGRYIVMKSMGQVPILFDYTEKYMGSFIIGAGLDITKFTEKQKNGRILTLKLN